MKCLYCKAGFGSEAKKTAVGRNNSSCNSYLRIYVSYLPRYLAIFDCARAICGSINNLEFNQPDCRVLVSSFGVGLYLGFAISFLVRLATNLPKYLDFGLLSLSKP